MALTSTEKKQLKLFEKNLRFSFRKREHLKQALTHKSIVHEQRLPSDSHNERLEFLGDAVLELCISHLLMSRFADADEGDLSKTRAAIVNEDHLSELARSIQLGNFLYLGKGEANTGGREKASLLANAYEAVIGAMFLDRGFKKVQAYVEKTFTPLLANTELFGYSKDYKTRLQEVSQGRFKTVPRYSLTSTTGPDHQKVFEVELTIRGDIFSVGKGSSKKAAEQEAAKLALEKCEEKGES